MNSHNRELDILILLETKILASNKKIHAHSHTLSPIIMAFISDNTTEEFLATVGNSSSGRHLTSTNDSVNANTTIMHDVYPSGYTITHIVFASIIVTILMIIIVVGNMLVIIAIITEKSLKNIQNWFIASLAVADFFLGLVIMPFSLANELMGYWIFGPMWCELHSAMDVLLSTASIMNLCLISLDRYWSITKAVEYLKTRTPARALVMIATVWIASALICIPPLLGWGVKRSEEELPQCEVSQFLLFYLPFVSFLTHFVHKYHLFNGDRTTIV